MSLRRILLTAIAIPASSLPLPARAAATFQVSATIVNSCTVTGTTLNFGAAIDPLATSTPVDATSTLSVTCTNTTPYSISLNAGSNGSGFSSRAMKSGTHALAYQLYLDSGRSSVWGDGTSGSSTFSGTGTGSPQALSIYGRIPSLANVVPGSYADTVTVTISY